MRSPLRSVLLIALVAAVGFAGYSVWRANQTPLALPDGPREVLPSSEFTNAEASIAYYRARLRQEPRDVKSRVALAQVLLQQARATGRETEYIPEAQRELDRALAESPDDYQALLLKASLLNTLHRFEEARDLSRSLIARHPRHAFPYGTLTDALVELGEYDAAVAASDSMLAIKPSLASYSRASYLRQLHGDSDGAIDAMRLAADAGVHGRADRAWALYQLGTLYLDAAKPDTATYLFEGVLAERPDYAYAVGGLGQVALAKGDADDAIRHFTTAYGMAPRDAFQEGLAEAYALKGDDRRAAEALRAVRAGLADARAMGERVDMEEADLMLDHGIDVDRALEMARQEVERRPGHLHANETYAWALHKNGRAPRGDSLPRARDAARHGRRDGALPRRRGLRCGRRRERGGAALPARPRQPSPRREPDGGGG